MKKYRIVITTNFADPRKRTDVLDFQSYRKFNDTFDLLATKVRTGREGLVKVERYFGKELVETVSL